MKVFVSEELCARSPLKVSPLTATKTSYLSKNPTPPHAAHILKASLIKIHAIHDITYISTAAVLFFLILAA